MSNLKISPDLFLEAAELNRFKQFIDDNGFRKNILDNTNSFGLIKNSRDFIFSNGKVERDLDQAGQKTIKIRELFGIDKFGNFLHLNPQNGIVVPNDGNWYWAKVAYAVSNIEKGTFSISGNGDLIDSSGNAELKSILRGMPNFPVRIKFANSQYNTLEYDVLEVIDDQHATIQHPASNAYGMSEFVPESGLQLQIVGTFTKGIAVPVLNKNIFNYDSAMVNLVAETFLNTAPTYVPNAEFYLARIKATDSTVIIQDKRIQYWEAKGSGINLEIDRTNNPLIGIESVQYNNTYTPSDRNIVKIAWGMRSSNWSIDSSNNIVTFNSGNGGKYKSVDDFQNGDLVGGRLYASNGKYGRITGTTKQGSAINFQLDVLDVDNFSSDGGTTLNSGLLIAVPDCDSVEILFTPNPADNVPALEQAFIFPVNELTGRCDILVYNDPSVLYNVQYRYKTIKEFTQYKAIPSDTTHGYYTESSFDINGNLLTSDERSYYTYTSDPVNGFIRLQNSPFAISKFKVKVDKGDIIGVTEITSFASVTKLDLIVGTNKNYVYIDGDISLPNDIYFALANGQEGNEFRIHLNCNSVTDNGYSIYIVQNYNTPSQATLKKLTFADFFQMKNQEGGIVIDLKYTGLTWVAYQNYELGRPYEIVSIDGTPDTMFDPTSGLGTVKGLFGYVICDQVRTVNGINIPDLHARFLLGQDPNQTKYNVGQAQGEETHILKANEQGTLAVKAKIDDFTGPSSDTGIAGLNVGGLDVPKDGGSNQSSYGTPINAPLSDAAVGHNNMPPYYAVILAKKVF